MKVVNVASWLDPDSPKGGSTKVNFMVESKEEANVVGESLIEMVENVGFEGASISKVELMSTTTDSNTNENDQGDQ